MRTFRLPLLAAGGVVVALAVAGVLACLSPVQTWVVRRVLAGRLEVAATVGRVSAGLNRVELQEVEWRQSGWLVRVPRLEVELPLLPALLSQRVAVGALRSRGWVVEPETPAAPGTGPAPAQHGTASAAPPAVPPPVAGGLLGQLALPFDLAVERAELDGELRLPAGQGRVLLRATGGGLGAGRDGRFEIASEAILVAPDLNAAASRAVLTVRMAGARSIARVEVEWHTNARGDRFPGGLELTGTLVAERRAGGETYTVQANSHGRTLLKLQAEYPRDSGRWQGEWRADFTESDLSALTLGVRTPVFAVQGGGRFEWAPAVRELQAAGQLAGTLEQIGAQVPELAAVGRLGVTADFDVQVGDDGLVVRRLDLGLSNGVPVATARVLQPFVFHVRRRELSVGDPAAELIAVTLQAVPLDWLARWVAPLELKAGVLRGELRGRPRAAGISLHASSPLVVDSLAVAREGRAALEQVGVTLTGAMDLMPEGWALEVSRLAASAGGRELLSGTGKVGRLSGPGEAIKLSGKFAGQLPLLQLQPAFRDYAALAAGELQGEVAASLGTTVSWHIKMGLQNLAAAAPSAAVPLPSVAIDLRADVGADGAVAYHVPVTIQQGERRSDLLVEGKARRHGDRLAAIEARATSGRLHLEDLQALGRALKEVEEPAGPPVAAAKVGSRPPPWWTGWEGTVALHCDEVLHGGIFRLTHLTGRAVLEAGRVRVEALEAGLGQTGRAKGRGALMYDGERSQPYGFVIDVDVRDFEPGRFLERAGSPRERVVEGQFDVNGTVAGRASSLPRLTDGAAGAWNLASRGGVFRGLPVTVRLPAANPGRVAGFLAAAGQAIGGLARRRDGAITGPRAEVVAEFAAALHPIVFDQLSVRLVHDAGPRLSLLDFTLIAPELRLSGRGSLLPGAGQPLAAGGLAMEYQLRARGRQGDLLKHLGALDAAADELGYSACTLPIRIGGTLSEPDASELAVRLEALALERSGVTEKASELFNRLLGGGK